MEDKPGPSSAAPVPQDPALLAEADAKFEEGIACIKANDLERAVQLFAEVLKVRAKHYGELATECASAYYRYGSALLYQAQDSDDVLGGPLGGGGEGDDADEKENDDSGPPAEAAPSSGEGSAPSAADDKGKGKAPVAEPEQGEEDEGSDAAAESDLQLAWENLEAAKFIWSQQPEQHTMQLADVHLLLGDVGMENEDFEGALADYEQSLGYLQKQEEEGSRRVAEVQYKRCMALQFLDRPQQALEAVQAAIACLKSRAAQLKAELEGAEGEAAERAKAEQENVAAVLGELSDKVEELQDVMEQHLSTKNALQSALEMIGKQERQAAGSKAGQPSSQATAAGAAAGSSGDGGTVEQEGFDKPGSEAAVAAAAAPAPVKDLGVVGRGTKRLNLAPVQVNAGAGATQEAPAAKKKRSLDDLMGGGEGKEGETTIGFGAAAPAAAAAAAPAAPIPAASAALPAFLQPAAVKAVYGGEGKAAEGGQQ